MRDGQILITLSIRFVCNAIFIYLKIHLHDIPLINRGTAMSQISSLLIFPCGFIYYTITLLLHLAWYTVIFLIYRNDCFWNVALYRKKIYCFAIYVFLQTLCIFHVWNVIIYFWTGFQNDKHLVDILSHDLIWQLHIIQFNSIQK